MGGRKDNQCLSFIRFISSLAAQRKNEPQHDKTNRMTCATSEDSDQLGHLPSWISPLCALRTIKDPRLCHAHTED